MKSIKLLLLMNFFILPCNSSSSELNSREIVVNIVPFLDYASLHSLIHTNKYLLNHAEELVRTWVFYVNSKGEKKDLVTLLNDVANGLRTCALKEKNKNKKLSYFLQSSVIGNKESQVDVNNFLNIYKNKFLYKKKISLIIATLKNCQLPCYLTRPIEHRLKLERYLELLNEMPHLNLGEVLNKSLEGDIPKLNLDADIIIYYWHFLLTKNDKTMFYLIIAGSPGCSEYRKYRY